MKKAFKDSGGPKKIKDIIEHHQQQSNICKLNPDKKTVDNVMEGLIERKERFGEFYCPCRVLTGEKREDKKIICPCVWHEDEVKNKGICLCGLFVAR